MLRRTHSLPLITLLLLCLADALRIDDFDHMVEYHGAWTNGANIPDDVAMNWDSTLHYSNISGATATIKFTGTSIAVYGSFHPPGRYNMVSQYSIDGQLPYTFTPNPKVPVAIHRSLFYSSPQLPYGEHTLVVTNLAEQLFLDFFDVQDEAASTTTRTPDTGSPTNPNIPTQTQSPASSGSSQMVTVTAPATSHLGASSLPASSNHVKTGPDSQQSTPGTDPSTIDATFYTGTPTAALLSGSPTQSTTEIALPSNSTSTSSHPTITPIGAAQSSNRGVSKILSKGAIAGIAMGSVIIVAVLSAGFWWYKRSREPRWLATDLHFEPSKMTLPDPSFRGHRPTLSGFIYGERRASERRGSAPSSSIHLIGNGSSTPSTYSA